MSVSADFSFRVETSKFDAFCDSMRQGMTGRQQATLMRATALKFIAMVVPETPVDTGRARAGWAAMADASGVPVHIGGTSEGVAKGRAEGSFELFETRDKAGVRIRNGVPYIVPLEYGHSDQRPEGFVRVTLRRMRTGILGDALQDLRSKMASANAKARATGLKWRD